MLFFYYQCLKNNNKKRIALYAGENGHRHCDHSEAAWILRHLQGRHLHLKFSL